MANKDTFSIYFHHGGRFMSIGSEKMYYGGEITPRHDIDIDRFGYLDLEDEVEKLGYNAWDKLLFKIPRVETSEGLKDVHDDAGVMEMVEHVSKGSWVINVFVEGGKKIMQTPATIDDEEYEPVDVHVALDDWCNEGEEVVFQQNEESDEEDQDYNPVGESDTDDGLSNHELAPEDEEYIEARQNKAKYRKPMYVAEVVDRLIMESGFQSENCQLVTNEKDNEANPDRECHSEYEDSDGDMNSDSTSSEGGDNEGSSRIRKKKMLIYDPKCDHKTLKFVLGMRFENGYQCKAAIQRQAIMNGYNIQMMRSKKNQVEVKCVEGCPWRIYGSMVDSEKNLVIKSYKGDHRCHREMNNRQATSNWIAKEYINMFRRNPNYSIQDLEYAILDKYALKLSRWKLYRAKWKALEMLRGSVVDHYACLRSYIAELLRVDKEGRFEFLLDDDTVFKAFFIGFSALKKGFLKGCRPIIGFDGCFLKTFMGGALLCAIGKDGNNQMFPIAWAVVEAENESCWTWFLTILFEELNITEGLGWTFISDQQKGLINAIKELAPYAAHRNCARHIYCNWKKEHKGQTLKNIFWRVARSTYEASYKIALEEMKEENEASYHDFLERDPQKFCKAYISTLPKCDMIDNNVSETFNGYIVQARGKHIIDMLENIRTELMERQHTKLMEMSGITDIICPRIREKVEQHKYYSRLCHTKPAVGDKFQVSINEDQFVVDLENSHCTCRYWDITGIPCTHACSAIHFMKKDPADFVDPFLTVEKYIETYQHALEPLNGKKMWPATTGNPIKPPPFKKMPGRPKKKRRRAREEEPKNASKLKKIGVQMTCQKCFQVGHNRRSCINNPVERAPKSNVKRGRPPKVKPQPNAPNFEAISGQTTSTQQSTSVHAKERALARQGYGVRIFEETGNIYLRMPKEKRALLVHTTNAIAQAASTRGRGGRVAASTRGRGSRVGRAGPGVRGNKSGKGGTFISTSSSIGNEDNTGTQESTIE